MQSTAQQNDAPAKTLNGLDPQAIGELIDSVAADPAKGQTRWSARTEWTGGARTTTRISDYSIGGQRVEKDWTISIDEPLELGGTNTRANPQEHLLAAVNACMLVTFAVYATLQGVTLESLELHTTGDIDLRGLFGLDESVNPGYDALHYTLRVKGDASPEQFRAIHEAVQRTSPNFANLARAVAMRSDLIVDA